MIDRLIYIALALPVLVLLLFLFFQSVRRPSLLVAASIYTESLDHMGRLDVGLLTFNNLLKIVLLAVMLLWMLSAGKRLRLPRLLLWFLPWLIFSGLSIFYSSDFLGASFAFIRVCVVWTYALFVANFIERRSDVAIVMLGMVVTALVVGILAHLQTLNLLTMGVVESFQKQGPEASSVRAMSTFWDSNRMGQFLGILSLFLMALLTLPRLRRVWKLSILIVLFVSLGAILLSFSRSAWLVLFAAGLLYLRFRQMRGVIIGFSLLALLAIAYMSFFTPYGASLWHRASTLSTLSSDFSGRFRFLLAMSGLEIWADGLRWIWGGGFYSFSSLVVRNWDPSMSHEMIYHSGTSMSHTLYITVLTEGGWIGALLFLLWLRSIFREAGRTLRRHPDGILRVVAMAVWVIVAAKLVDFLFNPSYFDNQFWLILGLLGSTAMLGGEGQAARGPEPRPETPEPPPAVLPPELGSPPPPLLD